MRFACLGSGSRGNALVVEAGRTRIMLDCGFGIAETVLRLERIGLSPQQLAGVVVTHEHDDHIGGAAKFARQFNLPLWLTHGTLRGCKDGWDGVALHVLDGYRRFGVGDIEIEPYPVPHDAREPAQYVFGDGARRLGVLTDAGCSTPHIAGVLSGCDALVLECNHDIGMLRSGDYPPPLKRRVAGRYGHLDNAAAAELLAGLRCARLQHLIAAHLSQKNNTPELARTALAVAAGCTPQWVGVASQEEGFGWRQIT